MKMADNMPLSVTKEQYNQILSYAISKDAKLYVKNRYNEKRKELKKIVPASDFEFVADPQNWNSVLNLQNLDQFLNTSKLAKPLAKWAKEKGIPNRNLYVKDSTSLELSDFKQFVEDRQDVLVSVIKALV
ncbi:MAG: hypothetical protein J5563_03355, partial [Clostridia bacterium]|nr:hypothetical protein [Clostridia bacterium]